MNRLVLIGNGFDLAHNLKTSYYDFIFDYLKNAFAEASRSRIYSDQLIEISVFTPGNNLFADKDITLDNYLSYMDKSYDALNLNYSGNYDSDKRASRPIEFKVKSNFFKDLLIECQNSNWVNIENKYYKELLRILNIENNMSKEQGLLLLNDSLFFLIQKLEIYLKAQVKESFNPKLGDLLFEKINRNDIVYSRLLSYLNSEIGPNSICFLNFNYTNTIEKYVSDYNSLGNGSKASINYIHGEIGNADNPMIFGFGDELDDNYSRIEREVAKGFLRFIKSFSYFKSPNYHNLIRFIESDDFQVYVVGHSCGLSDRTMLNMIFEHENCKSIKVFYYNNSEGDNFTELTEEISRHFTNKKEMRKKIAHKKISHEFPQMK